MLPKQYLIQISAAVLLVSAVTFITALESGSGDDIKLYYTGKLEIPWAKKDSKFYVEQVCIDECDNMEIVKTGCKCPFQENDGKWYVEWTGCEDADSELCFHILQQPIKKCTGKLIEKVEYECGDPFDVELLDSCDSP